MCEHHAYTEMCNTASHSILLGRRRKEEEGGEGRREQQKRLKEERWVGGGRGKGKNIYSGVYVFERWGAGAGGIRCRGRRACCYA